MKGFNKLVALGAVLAASSSLAFATPITGTIGVGPAAGTSTTIGSGSIDFSGPGLLNSVTGTLATTSTIGDRVTLSNLTFNSTGTTNGLNELLVSDPAFTFTVNSVTSQLDIPNDLLVLAGTGTFTETGFTPTAGTFQLTSTSSTNGTTTSTSLDITGAATAVTPEPNSLVLLGTGLVGAAGLLFSRRRNAVNMF